MPEAGAPHRLLDQGWESHSRKHSTQQGLCILKCTTMVVDMSAINVPVAVLARRARPIVERIIWCTVSTVGPDGTPRSRLMHPVWWWDRESPAALVSARPTPLKRAHLAANPFVSCYYWDPDHDTVAIDAVAEWVPERGRAAAWDAVKSVAAPVGFDPVVIW